MSGQKIVSMFQARKVAQQEATRQLEIDIQCLKDYEMACKSGNVTADTFTSTMGKASKQAQDYATNIKEGTGSSQVYADSQRKVQSSLKATSTASQMASIGVKALNVALNMFAGMAIAWGISKVIEGIEYLATASERAIEKTKELQQEISQISSDYQNERQALEGLKEEYDALTSKIGENGAEASLSADEYERYRDITSEILGITPKLITGWDDEGRAISNKNGLLQQSIDLLDEEYQKSLRNATTRPKLEEIASGVIAQKEEHDNDPYTKTFNDTTDALVNGFINDLKQIESEGKADEYKLVETMWQYLDPKDYVENYNNFWYDGIDTYEQLRDLINKVGYDAFADSFANEDNPIYQYFSSEQVNELIKRASEYKQQVELIEDEEEQIYQQYKDTLYDCAKAVGDGYDNLDESTKSGITQMINSFDYSDMTEKKFSDMGTDLKDFVDKLSTDDTLRSYFNNLFKPMGEDESIEDYETRVKTGIDEITSYCENNYPAIKLSFGDVESDVDKLKTKYNTAVNKFTNDSTQTLDDVTAQYQEVIDNEYQKIQDWGLGNYAQQIKDGTIQSVFGNVDMDKRTIITWSDELKQTYKDALDSWDYDPEVGSIDTVFGGSNRFGEDLNGIGLEVAFTPILPDGTFLSQDAVYDYINTILAEAYANDGKITEDELTKIDAQGRQIGNTFIHGIFAGIDDSQNYDNNGNWAETVGRLLHFSGDFGAVEIAKREKEKAIKEFSDSNVDLEKFFTDNSINTTEEIEYWNKVTDGAQSATEAVRMYNEAKKTTTHISFDQSAFNEEIKSYEDGYSKLISAQEEWNESKAISASTFADLQENGLLEYLTFTSDGLEVNTEKLLSNAQSCKDKAVADLHAAMTSDLLAIAIGDTSKQSEAAQSVIAQLGNNAETAGNQAMTSVTQWATLGETIATVMKDAGVQGISTDKKAQMSAVYDYYKKLAIDISNIDITIGNSSSGSTANDLAKAAKESLESTLTLYKAELNAGIIDLKTYLNKCNALLDNARDKAIITTKEYWDYQKEKLETQLEVKICLAS